MKSQKIFDTPLFGLGFRVFFALAGLSALILIVLWNAMFKDESIINNYFTPRYWHAHEMLMGYSVAVITGFLLTAVKNWTGKPTLSGDKLAALALLWLYGRILPFYANALPDALIALIDLAFLPILAYQISKPLISTKYWQGLIFVGLLLLLALGNGLIHSEILGLSQNTAEKGFQLIVGNIIILTLIIISRVLPYFIERGLSGTLIIKNPLLDKLSIASAALVFVLQLKGISGDLMALTAIIAAVSNALRLMGWYVQRIWYVPLLWVLYAGYSWIIVAFFLTALSAYAWISTSIAIHAFTLGGIGVLTLGMMARVSLGHTGRALKASNAIVFAFVLINFAAAFRVLFPILMPNWYNFLLYSSTLAWLGAFSLFIFVYAPILNSPRIDNRKD